MVEHADYLAGFVVDDCFFLGVVEGGNGEAAGVVGVDGEVDFADVGEVRVKRVRVDVLAWDGLVRCCKAPT